MRRRIVLLSLILSLSVGMNVNAATSKTSNTVTGKEVLEYIEENVPTMKEVEEGTEAEVAVVIQTRELASIKKEGFTAVNYGALLDLNGNRPKAITKKSPRKNSWKYITSTATTAYLVEFTNTNDLAFLYQKKDEYDAHEEEFTYYGKLNEDGKTDPSSCDVSALKDGENALYIYEDRNYYVFDIKDPETDEVIGKFFIERKRASANPKGEKYK